MILLPGARSGQDESGERERGKDLHGGLRPELYGSGRSSPRRGIVEERLKGGSMTPLAALLVALALLTPQEAPQEKPKVPEGLC